MRKIHFTAVFLFFFLTLPACGLRATIDNITATPDIITAATSVPGQSIPAILTGSYNVNMIHMVPGMPEDFGGSGAMSIILSSDALQKTLNDQGFSPIKNARNVLSSYKEEGNLRVYLVNLPDILPSNDAQRMADVQGLVTYGNPQNREVISKAITIFSLRNQPEGSHIISAVNTLPYDDFEIGQIFLLMISPEGKILGYLPAAFPADQKIEVFWSVQGIVVKHLDQELSFFQLSTNSPQPSNTIESENTDLTIIYTNDEHGWMTGTVPGSGAAEMLGLWRTLDGFGEDENVLVLSGGDNWTGPAISTWFDGQSMVETMNALDYDASTIGNHEFDFGLEQLKARIAEAGFPYLSANLRDKNTGEIPRDLGINPYTIVEVGDLEVGIIGLTTLSTPSTTNPVNLERFQFIDYAVALREFVPEIRTAGADLVILIAHVCSNELVSLAKEVQDLKIPFMGGGHCHDPYSRKIGNTVVQAGGADLIGYAFTRLSVTNNDNVKIIDFGLRQNTGGIADSEIAKIIHKWQALTDNELNKEIGYLQSNIIEDSPEMQALVTESWLAGYPNADIAMTNQGGFRSHLSAGKLTLAHIIGMLPFDNYLIEVKLTGQQILKILRDAAKEPAIGGMKWQDGSWVLNKSGEPLITDRLYSILINDFMYSGGDGFTLFAQYDPDAYETGIDWRQPVIDWILSKKSSSSNPLDESIRKLLE